MKVNVLPKRKFSSNSMSSDSSMSESSSSSLVTEEDTSGNPLPVEIIEIRKRNKRLEKNLTNGIKNLKLSEITQNSEETLKVLETKPEDFISLSINSNRIQDSNSFKEMISRIVKLQNELQIAKSQLKSTEQNIYNEESQNISLKQTLRQIETFNPELRPSCCGCQIF
jgi:hypothetical protein